MRKNKGFLMLITILILILFGWILISKSINENNIKVSINANLDEYDINMGSY